MFHDCFAAGVLRAAQAAKPNGHVRDLVMGDALLRLTCFGACFACSH